MLHKDYQEDIKIKLINSDLRIMFELLKPNAVKHLSLSYFVNYIKYTALGLQFDNTIIIYLHNIKKLDKQANKEELKLFIIKTLFHEIRHIYQQRYKPHKVDECYTTDVGNGYESQWEERDANKFSMRMMNKHKKDINDLFNIDFDWEVIWQTLYIK
ncbi:DUF3920 family protein [Priestia megaterium]|uniref:DUF3920 family protein n=1 Tax=Priestia megaterium TaxID=1404 RepID=UPI0015E377BE|nr:DUF3920 family protein [Priestia megaterium]